MRKLLDCGVMLSHLVAIQTVLRRAGVARPYELLKDLTRTGGHMTQEALEKFIETLEVSEEVKAELKAITPFSFVGVVPSTDVNK